MSELGGEKIDIIEWSEDPITFIEDALSPAQVLNVTVEAEPNPDSETVQRGHVTVEVAPDQQSLAIGRGGQNVRLAAKLTGWKIDIMSVGGGEVADSDGEKTFIAPDTDEAADIDTLENEDATTTKPELALETDQDTEDRDLVDTDQTEEINEVDTPEEAEELMNEAEDAGPMASDDEVMEEITDANAEKKE